MIMAPQINISEWYLKRLATVHDNQDVASQTIREMASELLSLRQQIAQMQAPAVEPAQSAAEPVGYISGWINGHLAIRLLDPALALSTGTALFLQPPTVPPAISEQAQAVPYGWHITGLSCLMVGEYAERDAKAAAKRCGGTTKAIPLYTAPPAIDDETRKMTIDLCDMIITNKAHLLDISKVIMLREKLEAGNANTN